MHHKVNAKRTLGALGAALALCLSLVPARADTTPGYAYDPGTNTTTYAGVKFTDTQHFSGNATLMLTAGTDNEITVSGKDDYGAEKDGVYSQNSLTIGGSGTLHITAGGKGVISWGGSITVKDTATVIIDAGSEGITTTYSGGGSPYLVVMAGTPQLTIRSGGTGINTTDGLSLQGGRLHINAGNDGIYCDNFAEGSFAVQNTALDITANQNACYTYGDMSFKSSSVTARSSTCLWADGGLVLTDSSADLTAKNGGALVSDTGNIRVAGTSDVSVKDGMEGVRCDSGTVELTDTAHLRINARNAFVGKKLNTAAGTGLEVQSAAAAQLGAADVWDIGGTLTVDGSVVNSGTLHMTATGRLVNNGRYVQNAASLLTADAGGQITAGAEAQVMRYAADAPDEALLGRLGQAYTPIVQPLDYTGQTLPADGAGCTWNKETRTLTLSGAALLLPEGEKPTAAITLPEDAHILLADGTRNYIENANGEGIHALGDLLIYGNGAAFVKATTVAVNVENDLTVTMGRLDISRFGASSAMIGISAMNAAVSHAALRVDTDQNPCVIAMETLSVQHSDAVLSSGTLAVFVKAEGGADPAQKIRLSDLPAAGAPATVTLTEGTFATLAKDGTPLAACAIHAGTPGSVVFFDANDGSPLTYRTVALGACVSAPVPTRGAAWYFDGWWNGTQKLTADTAMTAPVTYTAKWVPLTRQTLVSGGVSLSGLLAEGAKLIVVPITAGDTGYAALLRLVDTEKNQVAGAYEATLTGAFSGPLTLTFQVGDAYNGQTLTVYHALGDAPSKPSR